MKKIFTTLLVLCFLISVKAQNASTDFFVSNDTIIGKDFENKDVVVKYYKPRLPIYRMHLNRASDNLLLELRETNKSGTTFKNKGYIAMVGLDDKVAKWSKDVKYNRFDIRFQDSFLFYSTQNKHFCLEEETGNVLWENNYDFYYISPEQNIGLGYPKNQASNNLTAIDMTNGNSLWSKKIDRTHGWNDAYLLSDSVLLIAVNGIQAMNLHTGNGWTYQAKTSHYKVRGMIATNAVGILLGVLTGQLVVQTNPDEVTEMVSNMLIDEENNTILASKEMISRVNSQGEIIWSTPLPEKRTSKSSIFLKDSVIYMINRGYAFYNGGFSKIGDPYIAAFNLQTGKKLYLQMIPEKKDFIRNYQVINDLLFLVFENKVATYSLLDGSLINEKTFELEKDEYLQAFIESGIFVRRNDSTFFDIAQDYPEQNFLQTTQNRVFSLTDDLQSELKYNKNDVFEQTMENDSHRILTNNNEQFFLCDAFGKPILAFRSSPNMFLTKNRLISTNKEMFWEYLF